MQNKTCLLCKYGKFHSVSSRVRDSAQHTVIKCDKCSHVQLFPVPTLEEDKIFYDENLQDKNINYYGNVAENRKKSNDDTVRRFNIIKKLVSKNSRILEIGSGHGFFLEMMYKNGYDISGIEISKEKRRISKKITNAKVFDIDINVKTLPIDNFDMVVMFHVLEHIANPIGFLTRIKKLLVQRGKIIVEVPNSDDFQLKLNDSYRNFYWQRAHIHYFTPKILKKVIDQAGFRSKIVGIQRYSIENMFNWKLTNKPQLNEPIYHLPAEYEWIEKYYKNFLEKKLISDTIIAIGS